MKNTLVCLLVFALLFFSCSTNIKKEGLVFQNETGDSYRLLIEADSVFIFEQRGNNPEDLPIRGNIDVNGNICFVTPFDWENGCKAFIVKGAQLMVDKYNANDGKSINDIYNFNQDKSTDKLSQHFKKYDNSNQSADTQAD
jgi:hypothetical protein